MAMQGFMLGGTKKRLWSKRATGLGQWQQGRSTATGLPVYRTNWEGRGGGRAMQVGVAHWGYPKLHPGQWPAWWHEKGAALLVKGQPQPGTCPGQWSAGLQEKGAAQASSPLGCTKTVQPKPGLGGG